MLQNYFTVAIRNILKYKVFSFINIFGLAAAMSVCMLIILMLSEQKSFDQFHAKKERTYRILTWRKNSPTANATTPFPLANVLKTDYPFIEETTRLVKGVGGDLTYDRKTMEVRGYFADPAFFDVFSYQLVSGDKKTALLEPNSMIITRDLSRLLFGDEDPIGRTVEFVDRGLEIIKLDFIVTDSPPVSWGSFKITGIMPADRYKSHLKFDVLVSASSLDALYKENRTRDLRENWETYSRCFTYAVVRPSNSYHPVKCLRQE